jgi:hypothetical protein
MRLVMIGLVISFTTAAAAAQQGNAPYQPWGPRAWCTEQRIGGNFPNCAYYTYEQCRGTATVGSGLSCIANPFYAAADSRRKPRRQ